MEQNLTSLEDGRQHREAAEECPVKLFISYPEHPSRLLALLTILLFIPKFVLVIPHMVILYFIGLASVGAMIIAEGAVLFTGRYPRGLFEFIVGVQRWQLRVNCYFVGLSDRYPPFRLRE